jgi:hypothetical protein
VECFYKVPHKESKIIIKNYKFYLLKEAIGMKKMSLNLIVKSTIRSDGYFHIFMMKLNEIELGEREENSFVDCDDNFFC